MPYSVYEIACVLEQLGYVEEPSRGTGSHRWFVLDEDDGRVFRRTMIPTGLEFLHPRTFEQLLRSLGMDVIDFNRAERGDMTREAYLELLQEPSPST